MTDTDTDVRDHVCVNCGETAQRGYTLERGWVCVPCVEAFAESCTEEDEYGDPVEGPVECFYCEQTVPEAYDLYGEGALYCLDCIHAFEEDAE